MYSISVPSALPSSLFFTCISTRSPRPHGTFAPVFALICAEPLMSALRLRVFALRTPTAQGLLVRLENSSRVCMRARTNTGKQGLEKEKNVRAIRNSKYLRIYIYIYNRTLPETPRPLFARSPFTSQARYFPGRKYRYAELAFVSICTGLSFPS